MVFIRALLVGVDQEQRRRSSRSSPRRPNRPTTKSSKCSKLEWLSWRPQGRRWMNQPMLFWLVPWTRCRSLQHRRAFRRMSTWSRSSSRSKGQCPLGAWGSIRRSKRIRTSRWCTKQLPSPCRCSWSRLEARLILQFPVVPSLRPLWPLAAPCTHRSRSSPRRKLSLR